MGYLKIITAILIWSSLGVFVRKIGQPTLSIVFYPAATAAVLQLLILLLTGRMKGTVKPGGSTNSILLLSLFPFFFMANMFLFFYAFKHTTIANAVFTHYTAPIFVALLAPVFLKERISKTIWFAIILSSLGLWLMLGMISSQWAIFIRDGGSRGIIAGVLSGLAYALIILTVRGIVSKYSALLIIFVQNSIVSLVLLPFILTRPIMLESLSYMVIMGIVHSTIAPLFYVQGFRSVKANEAAVLGYIEPVGAIILALIFLHEVPSIQALFGGALILYSGLMIVRGKRG